MSMFFRKRGILIGICIIVGVIVSFVYFLNLYKYQNWNRFQKFLLLELYIIFAFGFFCFYSGNNFLHFKL